MIKTDIRLIALILVIFLIPLTGNAPAEQKTPEIYMPERLFNFGSVWDGDMVDHDFILTNKGTAPLEILKIDND